MDEAAKKPSKPPAFNPNALEFNPATIKEFRPASIALSSSLPVDAPEFVPSNHLSHFPTDTETMPETEEVADVLVDNELTDFAQLHVEDFPTVHPQPTLADHLDPYLFETGPILPVNAQYARSFVVTTSFICTSTHVNCWNAPKSTHNPIILHCRGFTTAFGQQDRTFAQTTHAWS